MNRRDSSSQYGSVSIALHWLVTVLVLAQIASALSFGWWPKGSGAGDLVTMFHYSTGPLILVLGILFLWWRASNQRPSLRGIRPGQRRLAHGVHIVLFLAVIVQPLVGIVMSMLQGYGVPFYGLFTIPPLLPEAEAAGDILGAVHYYVAWVLGIAIVVHLMGALYHHFVEKDVVLLRMFGRSGIGSTRRG